MNPETEFDIQYPAKNQIVLVPKTPLDLSTEYILQTFLQSKLINIKDSILTFAIPLPTSVPGVYDSFKEPENLNNWVFSGGFAPNTSTLLPNPNRLPNPINVSVVLSDSIEPLILIDLDFNGGVEDTDS